MTDTELEELDALEQKLWAEVQALEKPYNDKTHEWQAVFAQRNRERMKRELMAEIATPKPEKRERL